MSKMMFMNLQEAARHISSNFLNILVGSAVMHLVFGVTLGIFSSFLSIKFGSRYRCPLHDISFSRIDSFQKHEELVHEESPIQQKRILRGHYYELSIGSSYSFSKLGLIFFLLLLQNHVSSATSGKIVKSSDNKVRHTSHGVKTVSL